MIHRLLKGAGILLLLLIILILLLRFWPGEKPDIQVPFEVIAHRGVHQTFPLDDLTNETCTGTRIYPVEHEFLENTIPSIQAAFDAGATIVEIDIHHTIDNHIIVFHDWTLDCRTNGTGVTQEQTLEYLKSLDIGYGYTADGGKTFPLREKGIGLMPTLGEVLDRFPNKKFILDHKSGKEHTVKILSNVLKKYPDQIKNLYYWGKRGTELRTLIPKIPLSKMLSKKGIKTCMIEYIKTGSFGKLPESCTNKIIILPKWTVTYVWGWPNRFMQKIIDANSKFMIAEIDSIEEMKALIDIPIHGIVTNRIELIGPWLQANQKNQ